MKSSRLADGAAFAVLPAVSTSVGEKWTEASKRGGQCCPAREENKKREARVGESFSRDRALLRSAGASQAHYVSRQRFATLRNYQLLACQDLGIEVYIMLFRIQNSPQLLNYCRHSRRTEDEERTHAYAFSPKKTRASSSWLRKRTIFDENW